MLSEDDRAGRTLDRATDVAVGTRVGAGLLRPVETSGALLTAATNEYRRHLTESDCWRCAGGHWCSVLNRLDIEADAAAFAFGERKCGGLRR